MDLLAPLQNIRYTSLINNTAVGKNSITGLFQWKKSSLGVVALAETGLIFFTEAHKRLCFGFLMEIGDITPMFYFQSR